MAPKRTTRNPELIRGVRKVSRSRLYHKRGLFAIKAKNGGKFPHHENPPPLLRLRRSLRSSTQPTTSRNLLSTSASLNRPSLGTVLIILTGRFKGKRVVFSKQLTSGLLLITDPYKINGVPLRCVNQAYVIGTSTKIDISGVNVDNFDDKYFAKQVEKKKKKGESEFFEAEKQEESELPAEKKDNQKAVDAPLLKAYLGARFSLKSGVKPHELVF